MANSVDPDQTAPSVVVWSGSALFAYVILSPKLAYEILGQLRYAIKLIDTNSLSKVSSPQRQRAELYIILYVDAVNTSLLSWNEIRNILMTNTL